ncbi:MAG TPA: hypothetical protein VFW94_20135 [Candidatus Acidoferrales bacterium]|nr:hypothetical protein [Candidatus Acidoferrales bacterium]
MRLGRSVTLATLGLVFMCSRLGAQRDPEDQLISQRLASLADMNGAHATDCGTTDMYRPSDSVSSCAEVAFNHRKPFIVLYSGPNSGPIGSIFHSHSAYGLADDSQGNLHEVVYDSRGLLNLNADKNAQLFNGNRIRVTPCIKPIRITRTERGIVACAIPVDEQASKLAAQQKPFGATVCGILNDPAAFNNKLVRIHGYVSANFEYSELGANGCSQSIWFEYGNGGAPPALVAYVSGGARPGAEDSDGRLILPIPVQLLENSDFRRFRKLMVAAAKADARSEKKNPNSPVFYCVAATFVGRIDGVSDDVHAFHLKRKATDEADFLGFGQMGLYDAQFVMQSVGNDAVLEKLSPDPDPAVSISN